MVVVDLVITVVGPEELDPHVVVRPEFLVRNEAIAVFVELFQDLEAFFVHVVARPGMGGAQIVLDPFGKLAELGFAEAAVAVFVDRIEELPR